jgi:hypothetical protein
MLRLALVQVLQWGLGAERKKWGLMLREKPVNSATVPTDLCCVGQIDSFNS